jgi:hypothetical protein
VCVTQMEGIQKKKKKILIDDVSNDDFRMYAPPNLRLEIRVQGYFARNLRSKIREQGFLAHKKLRPPSTLQ